MNIAEMCYQHVKVMPVAKALEVLQFIAFVETKNIPPENIQPENELFEFIQHLPVSGQRSDLEINHSFQALRDEWGMKNLNEKLLGGFYATASSF